MTRTLIEPMHAESSIFFGHVQAQDDDGNWHDVITPFVGDKRDVTRKAEAARAEHDKWAA